MKRFLIITKAQFGYHTDMYKYCQHLHRDFDITYYCFDHGFKKKKVPGVKVIYMMPTKNVIKRGMEFFKSMKSLNQSEPWDIVFVKNFDFCFIAKYMVKAHNYILDLRTGSVSVTKMKRFKVNLKTKLNIMFFKRQTVISEGLANKFRLKNYFVLPLGADEISSSDKTYESIKILYVGTFDHRNIHETIDGLAKFHKKHPECKISYDVVGFGSKEEENQIFNSINNNDLNKIVKFHGRKTHDELQFYFDNCNVGVSYVPIKPYYDYQPVTKTFEYIYSGLVCIGTNTSENAKVIDETNGVLCQDNADSFYESLVFIKNSLLTYDSKAIRESIGNVYKWDYICHEMFKPYLLNLK